MICILLVSGIAFLGEKIEASNDVKFKSAEERKLHEIGEKNKNGLKKISAKEFKKLILSTENLVNEEDVNILYEQNVSLDDSVSKEEYIDSIIETRALYIAAKDESITVSEEEIEATIDSLKSALKATDAENEIRAYCKGAGISVDEYYDYVRPIYERKLIISNYLEKSISSKLRKENVDEHSKEGAALISNIKKKMSNKAIRKYDVKFE